MDEVIVNRIFNKLDDYGERLGETCNTITRIDQKLTDFIEAVNKSEERTKKNIENRYKNITLVFGSITVVSVLLGISKTLGLI